MTKRESKRVENNAVAQNCTIERAKRAKHDLMFSIVNYYFSCSSAEYWRSLGDLLNFCVIEMIFGRTHVPQKATNNLSQENL